MRGRRQALKVLFVSAAGLLWTACQRIGNGSEVEGVPTLVSVSHIQSTQTAVPSQSPVPEQTADLSGDAATSIPKPTVEKDEAESSTPKQAAWPSVERGAEGILITAPLSRFYETRYRNANPRPEIDPDSWTLTIDGLVTTPMKLGLDDLTSLPSIEEMRTLECISNPVGGTLIGNALWRGVRLADLLEQAGLRTGARELKMVAVDGYETSIPIALAQHPDSLLVYEMNGAPLTSKHGYPARILLPGRYGQKQPKWITHMEVINKAFVGYWEERGWTNEARVQINSQIWQPSGLDKLTGEEISMQGIAFADESGVVEVEVSADGGINWYIAELISGPSSYVWTEWQATVPVTNTSRPIKLSVRASDGNGNRQRAALAQLGLLDSIFPDGTSDIHELIVTVGS